MTLKEISSLIPLINQKLFLLFRINKLTIILKNFFILIKNLKNIWYLLNVKLLNLMS